MKDLIKYHFCILCMLIVVDDFVNRYSYLLDQQKRS